VTSEHDLGSEHDHDPEDGRNIEDGHGTDHDHGTDDDHGTEDGRQHRGHSGTGGTAMEGNGPQEWDSRYAAAERVWSAAPNSWVAKTVGSWFTGRALDLGAGEGRHSVWLAALGWQVTAVDFSAKGIERGRQGAEEVGVQVDWVVADARTWTPPAGETFDLILVSYLHLPGDVLGRVREWLAPGGALVVLGHALRNLTEGVGGPSDPRLLHTEAQYRAASEGLEVQQLGEVIRHTAGGDAIDLVLVARRPGGGQQP
jgi:SAM-dependent methyltransferase